MIVDVTSETIYKSLEQLKRNHMAKLRKGIRPNQVDVTMIDDDGDYRGTLSSDTLKDTNY